jgi:hypothetical protein
MTKVERKFSFFSYVTGYYIFNSCTVYSVQCMASQLASAILSLHHNYETFSFYQTHSAKAKAEQCGQN